MIKIGIDEVGRGCWAGPLVAAAVAFRDGYVPKGLQDSKVLSQAKREAFAPIIEAQALAIGIGWVWPEEIDNKGVSHAVKRAMGEALKAIQVPYDQLIIDGNINYFPENLRATAIVKADGSVPAVSAASIIAKVARDAYMRGLAADYPGYGFEQHVGYGTKLHIESLVRMGVTDIHRLSYKPVKALLE